MKLLMIALTLALVALLCQTTTDPFGVKFKLSSLSPLKAEQVHSGTTSEVNGFAPAAHITMQWDDGAVGDTGGSLISIERMHAKLERDTARIKQQCNRNVDTLDDCLMKIK